jgi:glycine betaine transporter
MILAAGLLLFVLFLGPTAFIFSELTQTVGEYLSGGLLGLRTVSILTAFPFMLLMILMAYSLYRDLYQEWLHQEERSRILHQRIERMLLRESEREAICQEDEDVHPTASKKLFFFTFF